MPSVPSIPMPSALEIEIESAELKKKWDEMTDEEKKEEEKRQELIVTKLSKTLEEIE